MNGGLKSAMLAGRAAFVTGGSRGIGAAVSRRLAANGAAVAVNCRKNRALAESVVASIAANGGRAAVAQADVSKPEEAVRALERASETFGGIEIPVHNA